jgi:hypothetical protein
MADSLPLFPDPVPAIGLLLAAELDIATNHCKSGVPELVGQHCGVDAASSCPCRKRVPQDVRMYRLGDLGRLAQPFHDVGVGVLVERLLIASGSDARDSTGPGAPAYEAAKLPAQVGREADKAFLCCPCRSRGAGGGRRQFEQILLAQSGDLAGAEAGFAHDSDDEDIARWKEPVGSKGGGQLELESGCWWSESDSNRRPPPCEGGALPAELSPHHSIDAARPVYPPPRMAR